MRIRLHISGRGFALKSVQVEAIRLFYLPLTKNLSAPKCLLPLTLSGRVLALNCRNEKELQFLKLLTP